MDDEQRRLKKQWQTAEKQRARVALPLSDDDFAALFHTVETLLSQEGCDHSLRFTTDWIADKSLAGGPLLEWLADNGGYCDCEVVSNARDAWQQIRDGSG